MGKWLFDAGHGGNDSGACYNGRKESNDVLRLTKRVGEILSTNDESVNYTRLADTTVSLSQRSSIENQGVYDYFVSFHRNAVGAEVAKGVETHIYSRGGKSEQLANKVNTLLVGVGFVDRKVKVSNFHVLRETKCAAILIEVGFIDNSVDNGLFDSKFEQIAQAIAKGCLQQMGKDITLSTPNASSEIYRVRKSWSDAASQKGAFNDLNNAKKCADQNSGYSVFDSKGNKVYPNTSSVTPGSIGVGSVVKVTGSKWATGEDVPGWVKSNSYKVIQVNGNKVLLDSVMSWIYISDVILVSGGVTSTAPKVIGVGSIVKVTGSKWATGESVPGWVKSNSYKVIQVNGNKVLLDNVMSWVYVSDVVAV